MKNLTKALGLIIMMTLGFGVTSTVSAHGYHKNWSHGHYHTAYGKVYRHRTHHVHRYRTRHCRWVTRHDHWGHHYKVRRCHNHYRTRYHH